MNKFTYTEYGIILDRILDAGYFFKGYHEESESMPVCVIRHDLDLDIGKAIYLAEVEYSKAIATTYCVMVRSGAYNLFSVENSYMIEKILGLGHHLGLHFDCAAYNGLATVKGIAEACKLEVGMIEKWFGIGVKLVSYHKPNALVLSGTSAISTPIPHAYMYKFLHGMTYLSDSYGFWRYGHPTTHASFTDKRSLNLNIHPIWWTEKTSSPLYALTMAMEHKKVEMRGYMLTNIVGV